MTLTDGQTAVAIWKYDRKHLQELSTNMTPSGRLELVTASSIMLVGIFVAKAYQSLLYCTTMWILSPQKSVTCVHSVSMI